MDEIAAEFVMRFESPYSSETRTQYRTCFGMLDFFSNSPGIAVSARLDGVELSYLNLSQKGDKYDRQQDVELAMDIAEVLHEKRADEFIEKHQKLLQRAMVEAIHNE